MQCSQLYFAGQLFSKPEISATKNGKLWVKLLLQSELVRSDGRGGYQTERLILPINCFSREAEAVKELRVGAELTLGCHLYGTRYEASDGSVKHGVQLVADAVLRR
jgi:single-stranded DNA-binding protein